MIIYLKARLSHARERLKRYDVPEEKLSKHGMWSKGYWQAKVSTYENLIDEIEGGHLDERV